MKASGNNSGRTLFKIVAIALIGPSAVVGAQRETGRFQSGGQSSPRPAYQSTQPAQKQKPGQYQEGNGKLPRGQAGNGGQRAPSLYGNGVRQPDRIGPGVPPGHLADWLAQHGNLPPAQQEQLLVRDPYFLRLNPMDQRKVLNQLHQMGTMNDDQLRRRLARAEMIERLSPAEKMQVNASAERMKMLPEERRELLRRAFKDLRAVPMADRDMVLSSSYYRTTYSPAERVILHDLLRVEPYEP